MQDPQDNSEGGTSRAQARPGNILVYDLLWKKSILGWVVSLDLNLHVQILALEPQNVTVYGERAISGVTNFT